MNKNSGGAVTSTKTYYPAGGVMRVDGTRYYVLKDHLGSASVVTNQSATTVGEDRFYPFGETRFTTGNMQTDKLFTGQREITGLGIYNFGARFYSPKLGRFLSADTIVPGYANPQSWNRYSYVANRPLNLTDPTGHRCSPQDDCAGPKYSLEGRVFNLKWRIKHDFGITMSDAVHNWDAQNLMIVYQGLSNINNTVLGGNVQDNVGGSTFLLDGNAAGHYSGFTSGNKVTFYTSATIPLQNLYHEFGHLLDNAFDDAFSSMVGKFPHHEDGVYMFGGYSIGHINSRDTLLETHLQDPYWTPAHLGAPVDALQHPSGDPAEQWADMFANFVAGNIDMKKTGGQAMHQAVSSYLSNPYLTNATSYSHRGGWHPFSPILNPMP